MVEAKKMYVEKKFRTYTRRIQEFTNKDFERAVPVIKEKNIKSKEKDSFEMAEFILKGLPLECNKPTFPVYADWHHYLLPGIIVVALRNWGYEITVRDTEEGMKKGSMLAYRSYDFTGISRGAA